MSRSVIVRRLALAAGSFVLVSTLIAVAPALASADTSATVGGETLALDAANSISSAGIITGWDTSQGVKQEYVTRGDLAILLARVLKLPASSASHFTDVTSSMACFGAVGALYEAGLLTGDTATTFAPDQLITREQAVLWIIDALGRKVEQAGTDPVPYRFSYFESTDGWLAGFNDRGLVGSEYARAVANAYRLGIVDATSDGWFYPTLALSWGDAAIMIDRAFVEPVRAKDTYPEAVVAQNNYPDLQLKSQGPLVWYLEYQLAKLQYCPGPIDGVFDQRTSDAVMAFEKVEKLKRTGLVGATVWQRLPIAQTPVPRKSEPGTRVEINVSRQVLMVITDNKVWKIIPCSTGRSDRRTHTGHFRIQEKYKGWVACTTLSGVMFYPSYVVSKSAIHGFKKVPPWPASHGCIRIPVWMAQDFWYETPTGTTVDIYN